MLDQLTQMMQAFLGLGPTVILPVAIFFLGLFFGQKPSKALKSGLTIGIGFVGIFLVVDLLVSNLGPAAKGMVERFGLQLNAIDTGWPTSASIAWGSPIAGLIIPVGIAVNIIMLVTKTTKTMDVDIWNYWHFAFMGGMVYATTGSILQAVIASVIFEIIVLKIADYTAPYLEEYFDLPGVSIPTGSTVSYVPIGIPLVKLCQKIPVIKDIELDTKTVKEKFGIFGEPMFIGIVLGAILAVLAGYAPGKIINTGISMGAVMYLMPKMVGILMDGLNPVSESARDFLNEKFEDADDIYIGLDAAVSIGHPSVIATALILVPITVALAVILPGNQVLPFGDLATIPFVVSLIVAAAEGNIFHSVISGVVVITMSLYMATDLAPEFTQMAQEASVNLPKEAQNATLITAIDQAGNLIQWVIYKIWALF
ncbi:PTS galactitol transporter subunit IIC [Halanaerocella petrolearia]